jgi:hypothetical protein
VGCNISKLPMPVKAKRPVRLTAYFLKDFILAIFLKYLLS